MVQDATLQSTRAHLPVAMEALGGIVTLKKELQSALSDDCAGRPLAVPVTARAQLSKRACQQGKENQIIEAPVTSIHRCGTLFK